MLRNYYLFLLIVSFITVLISCNKDNEKDKDPDKPQINLEINGSESIEDFTANVGDTVTISGTVEAEGTIASLLGFASFGETTDTLVTFGGDSSSTEFFIDPIEYIVNYTAAGEEISFIFRVADEVGAGDTVEFYVQVNESPISSIENIYVGGFNHSIYGNILNILEDTAYYPSNVKVLEKNQEGTDLLFAYVSTEVGWQVAAPDDAAFPEVWNAEPTVTFSWPFFVENKTRLLALPESFNFGTIQTSSQLEDLFEGEDGSSSISSLAVGDVIAFKLDRDKGEKIGVLHIEASSGNKKDNRQLLINIKVQK